MKIGIQVLAYNCEKTFEKLIKPWVELKEQYDIKIWVGSGQFKEYANMGCKNLNGLTLILLNKLFDKKDIDLMTQVDADEFYSVREANNLIEYCIKNPKYDYYNTIFKQVIGEGIVEDWSRFSAGWIKRYGGIKNYYFDMHWWFNDNFDYRESKGVDIPKHLVNPYHYTWTNDDNTTGPSHIKEKIEYQNKIYSDGCGYKWDEKLNKVIKK